MIAPAGRARAPQSVPESVVLVDAKDSPIGIAEKQHAHRAGLLHRAFSVFLFDDAGRMLLQQRAATKYHSPGLWSNACCSHPRPGEATLDGAQRRLREEIGIDAVLQPAFAFTYRADVGGGLVEHEFDHVFTGSYAGPLRANPAEVAATRWAHTRLVDWMLRTEPHVFTPWFRIAWDELGARGLLAWDRAAQPGG